MRVSRATDTPSSAHLSSLTTDVVQSCLGSDPGSVPVRPSVPLALKTGPFTSAEARDVGVTRDQLRGAGYRRLGSGLYCWAGIKESPLLMLSAVARRLPPGAAFSGVTAAWLHGLDVEPCNPIEVTIPKQIRSGHRAGSSVRRAALAGNEIVLRRGLPTTSAIRCVVDLGRRNSLTEGVVAADMFLHARLVTIVELNTYVADHRRTRGIVRLRRVVDLVEPKAESPMVSGFGCSSCLLDSRPQRRKFPSKTIRAVSWAVQTCSTAFSAWRSNTTAAIIATGWLKTIAARTA